MHPQQPTGPQGLLHFLKCPWWCMMVRYNKAAAASDYTWRYRTLGNHQVDTPPLNIPWPQGMSKRLLDCIACATPLLLQVIYCSCVAYECCSNPISFARKQIHKIKSLLILKIAATFALPNLAQSSTIAVSRPQYSTAVHYSTNTVGANVQTDKLHLWARTYSKLVNCISSYETTTGSSLLSIMAILEI